MHVPVLVIIYPGCFKLGAKLEARGERKPHLSCQCLVATVATRTIVRHQRYLALVIV